MKYIKVKILLHDRNMTIVFQFVTAAGNHEMLFKFVQCLPKTAII
jgi:hypothetical protein